MTLATDGLTNLIVFKVNTSWKMLHYHALATRLAWTTLICTFLQCMYMASACSRFRPSMRSSLKSPLLFRTLRLGDGGCQNCWWWHSHWYLEGTMHWLWVKADKSKDESSTSGTAPRSEHQGLRWARTNAMLWSERWRTNTSTGRGVGHPIWHENGGWSIFSCK
jgi:hypothetical protein